MNVSTIHSVILLLLLSLTVHEVHMSVNHDIETCDVCIHMQSNNDAIVDTSPQYVLLDAAFHLKIKAQYPHLKPSLQTTADLIRGPPAFS
jgi:hypothetical protein